MGSGAARTLTLLIGLASGAAAAECDRATFEAARVGGEAAALCIESPKGLVRFSVEIADTEAERANGLMGRSSLAPGTGMVFVYPTPRVVAFWMHDTPLPLDMLFIDGQGLIETIHADARPYDETPIWSGGPVRYVLEIAGGQAAALGLAPGQRVVPLD